MPANRRYFLQALGASGLGAAATAAEPGATVARIAVAARALGDKGPEQAARDEAFWAVVREAYSLGKAPINFMTGWYGALPRVVQDAVADYWRKTNEPEFHGYTGDAWWGDRRRRALGLLARHVNCSEEELAFTRNTTEAINTVIFGLDLRPGDELLTTGHDFLAFRCAMLERAARDGIVVKVIDPPPIPGKDPGELVDAISRAITPKTRALMVCHVYSGGPVAPIRAICDEAHRRGVRVIVDAALGFGHVETDLRAMDCDYYGASFHKFAGGPRGTGFLFVKKELIRGLWPSYGSYNRERQSNHGSDSIHKLVAHGTDTLFLFAAVAEAIEFHEAVGVARRVARLHYLKRYWADQVKDLPGVRFMAGLDAASSCALASVAIEGVDSVALSQHLLERYHILAPRHHSRPDLPAPIWVNTSPFTTPAELDVLVEALRKITREGLPS
jgi:isopenicillin-N epimerase